MAGENISSLLNEVWAAFRRAGIRDDLHITETIAALLLEQKDVTLTKDLPRKEKTSDLDESTIRENLQQASEAAGGSGNLFDRYVLFRLSDMRPGGQFGFGLLSLRPMGGNFNERRGRHRHTICE